MTPRSGLHFASPGQPRLFNRLAARKLNPQEEARNSRTRCDQCSGQTEGAHSAIGDALDLAECFIECLPQGISVDEAGDGGREIADLAPDEGQYLVDRGLDHGLLDEAALVALRHLEGRELAQAGGQSPQLQLAGSLRGTRRDALGLAVPGDDTGIDGIGLLKKPHGLGEAAHLARIDDGAGHTSPP